MRTGRVTFIICSSHSAAAICWRARQVVGVADIVISEGAQRQDMVRNAPEHADVIMMNPDSTIPLLPFYDLASRDGFQLVHIHDHIGDQWNRVKDLAERCGELGLTTELVSI